MTGNLYNNAIVSVSVCSLTTEVKSWLQCELSRVDVMNDTSGFVVSVSLNYSNCNYMVILCFCMATLPQFLFFWGPVNF